MSGGTTTLFRQYMLRLLLPGFLAFVLASLGSAWIGWTLQKKETRLHRSQLLQSFSQALIKPLWDCDSSTVQGILLAMVHQADFSRVQITEQCRQELLHAEHQSHNGNPGQLLALPLSYQDEHGRDFGVGTLEVWLQPHSVQSVLAENSWRYLTLLALFLVGVMGASLLVFRRLISQPLQQFQGVIRQNEIRTDVPPIRARQVALQDNELGRLADAYDALMERLSQVIASLQENQTVLQAMAHTDPLTGLGNRLALEEALVRALSRYRRTGMPGCVLLLDLNDFKPVNDTWGHAAGDHILQQAGRRLRTCLRGHDVAVRLGGDEFVMVVEDLDDQGDAESMISKIHEKVCAPYSFAGQEIRIGVSIGCAHFPQDGETTDALLNKADTSMYQQKRSR